MEDWETEFSTDEEATEDKDIDTMMVDDTDYGDEY